MSASAKAHVAKDNFVRLRHLHPLAAGAGADFIGHIPVNGRFAVYAAVGYELDGCLTVIEIAGAQGSIASDMPVRNTAPAVSV